MRFLLTISLIAGCAASKVGFGLADAEQALLRAERFGAPRQASYEYTMALRYLEKAREEAGYSELKVADALARKSIEWSDRAIISVERRGPVEDLPEQADPVDRIGG